MDSPSELHSLIKDLNTKNKARVVAGSCWDWISKRDKTAFDIVLPAYDYRRKWNLDTDGSLWIMSDNAVEEVGCIHTCQGLEVDYIGVISGRDLAVENGCLVTNPAARSRHDRTIRGWKRMSTIDRGATFARVDAIMRNTYRTLMTRGMKGCYVYCCDEELARYFKVWTGTN